MALTRNQENYIIMTVIYDELTDFLIGENKTFRDARELTSELCECPYEEVSDYVKSSIAHSLNHYGEIVEAFTPYLRNWKWNRLPLLTQSVLIMSYAHYYYVEKIDKRIVINIAVNLAKTYIEEKQAKFINAVLDGVLK